MTGRPIRIVAPAELPVDLDMVKLHLRVDGTDDDALISSYMLAATSYLDGYDGYLGRGIEAQTWAVPLFDGESSVEPIFPDARNFQVQRETAGVWTVEPGASAEPQSDGSVSLFGLPDDMDGVALTMETGWADAQSVPSAIKLAIMLLVAQWYAVREAASPATMSEPPYAVRALLAPYRVQVPA